MYEKRQKLEKMVFFVSCGLSNGCNHFTKFTGQRGCFPNFFHLLTDEVYRKVDINCILSQKIENFWSFCQIRSLFAAYFFYLKTVYFSKKNSRTKTSYFLNVQKILQRCSREELNSKVTEAES